MDKKYSQHPRAAAALPRIITSDVYCAACLLSLGCSLDKVVRNDRRRVAFVFVGERVRELKQAYKTAEPVYVVAQSFRDSLINIRRLVDETLSHPPSPAGLWRGNKRSALCPKERSVPLAASPMLLSRA